MGFILFIIASILWLPLTILNIIIVLFNNTNERGFFRVLNEYFYQTAVDIDRFGNRNFRTLFNCTLQKNGYKFGNVNETISSALGKNQRDKKLTKAGFYLCKILDKFDENHCQKSIQE